MYGLPESHGKGLTLTQNKVGSRGFRYGTRMYNILFVK